MTSRNSGDRQLEIPDPDQTSEQDPTDLSLELWIGIALSVMVVFFGWFLWIQPQLGEEQPFGHIQDEEQRQALQDRMQFDEAVERGRADRDDWLDEQDDVVRIFEVGSRQAAEAACRHLEDALAEGVASRPVRRLLRQNVNRRADETPWSCLIRLYVTDRLPEESELAAELSSFWQQVFLLQDHGRLMKTVLDDLQDDQLPETAEFDRWLRRCALDLEYPASRHCQQIVRDLHIDRADDLLEVLLAHLDEPVESTEEFHDQFAVDLRIAARTLGNFARSGQPASWRIEETDQLPDYDVDFRLGALFNLCRLMNSPDDDTQAHAADALGDVTEISGRPNNPHMHYRWRKACRLAFGDPDSPQQHVPALGVAMVDDDRETVDYSMQTLIDRQVCEIPDGYPVWFCGSSRWTGGSAPIHRVMGDHFADTAYVEWYELDELAEVMPQE